MTDEKKDHLQTLKILFELVVLMFWNVVLEIFESQNKTLKDAESEQMASNLVQCQYSEMCDSSVENLSSRRNALSVSTDIP